MKMKKMPLIKQSLMLLSSLVAVASLSTTAVAAEGFEDVPLQEKLIKIRDSDDGHRGDDGHDHSSGKLRVKIRSSKSSYREEEAIRLEVKGNRDFYLYLFNINPRNGRGVAILPNRIQTNKRIKYPGDNKWRDVPNRELEFYSDRPGKERIIMVASTRYLDVGDLKRRARSKSLGDFFEMEAPMDALDDLIGNEYGAKAIKIRSSKSKLPKGVVIKELNLRIR